jgi:hypothetical protein
MLIFAQGQIATLTATFVTSPDGIPVEVPDATIQVVGPGGMLVLPPTPMIYGYIHTGIVGFYWYDWAIPNSLPLNIYTVVITGTVMGVPNSHQIFLKVVPAGTRTLASASQRAIGLIAFLETYIGRAQRIPVYNEVARRNSNQNAFQLSWPRWNYGNHEIRLNGKIVNTGYTIDMDTALVTFSAPLHSTDRVEASYNFRYFNQLDELRFLSDALTQINLEAPGTNYTLENMPDMYAGVLMLGGTKNALRQLLFDLNFQEPSTMFGGRDGAKDAIAGFTALKENNEKEFERDKKQIKRAFWPKIASTVSPEYTLPGGRSRWFRYLFSNNIG